VILVLHRHVTDDPLCPDLGDSINTYKKTTKDAPNKRAYY
jgi:hypothetical protein